MNSPRSESLPLRRRFALAINLALSAGAAIAALGLAELALRFFVPFRPPIVVTQENRDLFVKSAIAGLRYELRPNFAGRAFGAEVRINSHGMRSPERSMSKPAGVRRVFVLGDSVAFGHGVAQEAAFPALLETMLSDGASSGRVEVINAAVPGYNSVQQEIVLREKAGPWQPDVVLVVAVVNDAEPAYDLGEDGMLHWENPPEVYREFIERTIGGKGWRTFAQRHFRLAALAGAARPHFLTHKYLDYLDRLYAADSAGWQNAQRAFRTMRDQCHARGIAIVLAFCPVPEKPEPDVLRRIRVKFAEFARNEGIPFVDLFGAEHSRPVSEVVLSPLDRHPNVLGHRLLAEALAPALRKALQKTPQ
ncbi:MAG: SGNH/GDSL hydrolase family protein [Candidatus Sumerlaeia bacterium]|nr:SGNH/GDSL hydrolase family protein [Candidatus Sumerlaeia bacterium]